MKKEWKKVAAENYMVIRAIKKSVIFISDDCENKEIADRLNSLIEDIHSYSEKLRLENPIFNLEAESAEEYFSELRKIK